MARKSKKSKTQFVPTKGVGYKILSFLLSLVMLAGGYVYFSMKYVPMERYEEQEMLPKMKEAYYVSQWCGDIGQQEFILWDSTRVDCLTKDYAIEFDFAKKWAESVGQALYYSKMTGKKPAVALILTDVEDYRFVKRIERLESGIQIFLIKAY